MKQNVVNKQQKNRNNQSVKVKEADTESWKYYAALAGIVLISFIAYLPVLHNGLINWDDNVYIINNPLLQSINLKEVFSQNIGGNYHPLTILTLAVEYHFFGLNATGYHAFNLLLHVFNIILVFYTIYFLSNKSAVALVASLLFGIHPMHVESVAWAAELKDLLYTFFFLASYIFYLKYLKDFKRTFYVFALVLFLLSILSKAMAASLPILLILTDYFRGRKLNIKAVLEKAPFFLIAITFGIVAVLAQKSMGATDVIVFSFPQRIIFACYGFISYLYKFLLPVQLSAYYPYPIKSGEVIPVLYYSFVVFCLALVAFVIYSLRYSKKIFFGIGFFAITVFLVLQLLPVGGTVMADRYSYIPSIGIFYLTGEGVYLLWSKKQKLTALILIGVFTIFFSVKSYDRCKVWEKDITLWNNVISQYQTIPIAYNNRGSALIHENKSTEAINDFNQAIELKPDYSEAYNNRGSVLLNERRYDDAINDFNMVIKLKPNDAKAYINRGVAFKNNNSSEKALNDFKKAIELKPDYFEAYNNRGNVFLKEKRYDEAIKDYNNAIKLKPDYALIYFNRGLAEYYSGKKDAACADLKQADNLGYQMAAEALLQICK